MLVREGEYASDLVFPVCHLHTSPLLLATHQEHVQTWTFAFDKGLSSRAPGAWPQSEGRLKRGLGQLGQGHP